MICVINNPTNHDAPQWLLRVFATLNHTLNGIVAPFGRNRNAGNAKAKKLLNAQSRNPEGAILALSDQKRTGDYYSITNYSNMKIYCSLVLILGLMLKTETGTPKNEPPTHQIITGAEQTEKYLPLLKNKRVGILANPTSVIGQKHLVDSLMNRGIKFVKAFGPEHGFRGKASAGVHVSDETDAATGIPIISLYGSKRKPSKEDLADVDIMIYDIQDVGCRFYTYINILRDVMEACAENNKELLILDRPNPNGYLVDGPILDMKYKSGIGQFPIPIAHGMTIGEFAKMINGEGWLPEKRKCKITIIPVKNYRHDMEYVLPIKPSPNLNTQQSIMLYPSTCLFEGIALNHGRGTQFPFTVLGAPALKDKYAFSYTPTSIPGMAESPLYMNEVCYGLDLRKYDVANLRKSKRVHIEWVIELYNAYPQKERFFDRSISKQIGNIDYLSGTAEFKKQIIEGKTAQQIRDSWEPGLSQYKQMRKKYLLYP